MNKIVKWLSLAIVLAGFAAAHVAAQTTINAASCNEADVATAISQATTNGDIVSIPAGVCTWTTGLSATLANSITIQGAGAESATTGGASTTGTDETELIDNTGGAGLMILNTTAGASLRITGIAFIQNSSSTVVYCGIVQLQGSSSAVRVDHCHFYAYPTSNDSLSVYGDVTGVADHDFFDALSGDLGFHLAVRNGQNWQGETDSGSDGNASWADTDHWGSSEFFFAEDDFFNNNDYVTDCSYGGRFVIRYSTIDNATIMSHGLASDPTRSCRAYEVYQNTFNSSSVNGGGAASTNGADMLVWGNTVGDFGAVTGISYYRISNATYKYPAPPNNWGYCGTAQTGTASPWDDNLNSTGYPCIDEPGRGAGDLLTGAAFPDIVDSTTGTQSWPHQVLDPIYVWDNSFTGDGYGNAAIVSNSTGTLLQDNRDYYQQMAQPCAGAGECGEPGTFNGTVGIGQGSTTPTAAGYTTCTAGTDPATGGAAPGVGYWDTANSTLYVCDPTNTWTAYYTPYTYPNPLTQTSSSDPAPPTNLAATPN